MTGKNWITVKIDAEVKKLIDEYVKDKSNLYANSSQFINSILRTQIELRTRVPLCRACKEPLLDVDYHIRRGCGKKIRWKFKT